MFTKKHTNLLFVTVILLFALVFSACNNNTDSPADTTDVTSEYEVTVAVTEDTSADSQDTESAESETQAEVTSAEETSTEVLSSETSPDTTTTEEPSTEDSSEATSSEVTTEEPTTEEPVGCKSWRFDRHRPRKGRDRTLPSRNRRECLRYNVVWR